MRALHNKWAFVTGASRGVGLRIALALSDEGCKVILHARTLDATGVLLARLKAKGREAHALAADLSSPAQTQELIGQVRHRTGAHPDILYNNAAIMTEFVPTCAPTFDRRRVQLPGQPIAPAKLCDAFC